ncbi:MAG: hypothetical protein ABF446_07965, partial [Acetobacter orientalis]|uniref:hypothetical protein n=1 Tax=Acetobacter orientalis TaxID=146474 RepID=UPI0039ECBAF3
PEPEPEPDVPVKEEAAHTPHQDVLEATPGDAQKPESSAPPVVESAPYFSASAALREAEQGGEPTVAPVAAQSESVGQEAPVKAAWQRMDIRPQIGAFKNGMPEAYKVAEQEQVGGVAHGQSVVQGVQNALLPLFAQERFWRMAWGVSFVVALAVIVALWCYWDSVVQIWPAAARLHS